MPEKRILAYNLIKFRKDNHLSQYEMAEECGISKETLSLIEREGINPTLETIQKCAAYIGETVARLLSGNIIIQNGGNNMCFPYCSIQHKAKNEYSKTYTTYGVGLLAEPKTEVLEILDFIADICLDCEDVKNLVYLLNYFQVSAVHFRSVVADYMADMEYYKRYINV